MATIDDDELPDPVYMRLHLLDQYTQGGYYSEESDSGDEGSISGEEIELDLTAPPPDSWFHGRISRQEACTRLEMISELGAYLIRESETQPGDYAISYLSLTGTVHHFKINSHCGDYYIGGRQFLSLGDLIGFYANCSCILENETLVTPVVPLRPVPLYMMLRATAPHTKTPGTDELSISPGEVFLLLGRLNDDWGWGRSQHSSESGLIPIVIMEDMTHEDPNLGRPWFHGSISREEAVDLLMRKGDVSSFLVRKAGSAGGDGQKRYSLAVKVLPEKVQRFLITKFDTGYYVFGGRPFNSIEDIIERYRKEMILDGLTLGIAVRKDHHSPYQSSPPSMVPNNSVSGLRNRTSSNAMSRTELPGDRSGRLLLRKGKKSPVHGKWKDFHFMLNYREKKLLYYEHESSHRAKGLLDLKQCKVYSVHPSLYGRDDCFVLMLRYLNELSFYYINAESTENAQEWLRLLRRCTSGGEEESAAMVQQIRSLSLSIRDCKLSKSASHVQVLVSIDGACIARTRVAPDTPYIFDELFRFECLPPYADNFSVEVSATKSSKGLGLVLGRDSTFGKVHVHLSDLPNGQEDDQWHQLLTRGSTTPRGSLRLVANFKHEVILPIDEYRMLKKLLLSDDLTTIEVLASVCKDHHAVLASTLVQIFCTYHKVIPIIGECIARSVYKEDQVATLFRASTLSTMLMDQFMKLACSSYLHLVVKAPIQLIMESTDSCELDPNKLPRGADRSQNVERLVGHVQRVLSSVFNSVDRCPPTLRYIFQNLQEQVVQKWPTDETVRTRAISGFLFLRFVCPALLKPQLFNLITETPSILADRTLKLVTKVVQNIANLVEFRVKESYMIDLNPFIIRSTPLMRQFVDDLANYGPEPAPIYLEGVEPARDLASIYHLCTTYDRSLEQMKTKQPSVVKVLGVLQTLRTAEKKCLNRVSSKPTSTS